MVARAQGLKRAMRAVRAVLFGEVYINNIGSAQLVGFHTGYRLSGMGGAMVRHNVTM